MTVRFNHFIIGVACVAAVACNKPAADSEPKATDYLPVPGPTTATISDSGSMVPGARIAVARQGPDGEWPMPAGDYASSRYSALSQITPENAHNLHAAWTFSTGVLRGHEGQPLVVGNTMYVVTPYPNVSYAIDLTQAGEPLKWKFRPENAQQAIGRACCDVVNRGSV
jgi:glucose dehydrogenase